MPTYHPCPKCGKKNAITIEGKFGKLDCPCGVWKICVNDSVGTILDSLRGFKLLNRADWEDRRVAGTKEHPVYGRDLLQPGGDTKQKFMDRYGDGIYVGKRSQLDGRGKKR
jgi:hypothetical protein